MRISTSLRFRIAALSALTVLAVAGVVRAQFSPPTCVPPNCNPAVIQNVALSSSAQVASINITGDGGIGAKVEVGRQAPTLTAATDYLYYGNVNGASTAGYLIALQQGSADRMKVSIAGQQQLPLGSAGAPSYSFIGDANTGLFSSAADSMSFVTNGVARTIVNNNGTTVNSGVLTVPAGSVAAPSITFAGDTNTGIHRSAADTINIVTGGVSRFQADATGAVSVPGSLTVNGTFTSSGGVGGDGSALTNLNASNIASGTLSASRLPTNVAYLDAPQTFTQSNNFNGTVFYNGAVAYNTTSVAFNNPNVTFAANTSFTGTPVSLNTAGGISVGGTSLNLTVAQNLHYGVVDVASTGSLMKLQTHSGGIYTDRFVVSAAGAVTAASFAGSGASLTSLNASTLSSGTVPSARISGTYANNLAFSGANTYSNRSTFGSATLNVAAGQHLIFGNVDTASAGNLLLLQNESTDRFRVDAAGNLTLAGTIAATGSLTSGGVNVCLQDGTDCPATLTGGGTTDYLVKFTGTGDTVDDSIIYEDAVNGRIGIGTTTPGKKFEVRNGDLGTYNGNITASFGSVSASIVAAGGIGVSGQAIGVGSYGAIGSGDTGVAGYGENYGGWFTAADNFGGAAVYAQWTGNAGSLGKALQAYTDRPAATAAYIEATDATDAGTRGLYVSTPYTVGAKALTVIGDSYFSHDAWVNNLSRWSELGADPAGAAEGSMAYVNNKFRCNEGGTWKNCTDGVISSVTGSGAGISVSPTTGSVVVSNTGVTSAVAGAGISVSGATGAVTITNTGDTNPSDDVTGSGTANRLPKFTGAATVGDSLMYDDGTNVGIANTGPSYKLDVTGNARISTQLGVGTAPLGTTGIAISGPTYGVLANGGTYGVYGNGASYGLYSAGNTYTAGNMGVGALQDGVSRIYAYDGSDAYAYIARDSGTNGKGIMAYGGYYGGFFRDTDSLSTLYAGYGGYGAYGVGSTSGGYFANTSGGGITYIGGYSSGGYGVYVGSGNTYGVVAYGDATGGRFYDADGTATVFLAGASYGVEIITGSAIKPSGTTWANPSDARLKKDIHAFSDGLGIARQLNPKNFTFNGLGGTVDGMESSGFIAQEVKDIVPYMIDRKKVLLHPDDAEETEIYVLDQSELPLILLNSVKELDLRIVGFEAKVKKIDELDAKLKRLERRVEELESEVEALRR